MASVAQVFADENAIVMSTRKDVTTILVIILNFCAPYLMHK